MIKNIDIQTYRNFVAIKRNILLFAIHPTWMDLKAIILK